MAKARSARLYADFWVHPRTAWMDPLHRCVYLHAAASHPLGVIEASVNRLANIHHASPEAIAQVIRELVHRDCARWWEEHETLWVIEAADRNICGSGAWKVWQSMAREVCRFPAEIRREMVARYPNLCESKTPTFQNQKPPGFPDTDTDSDPDADSVESEKLQPLSTNSVRQPHKNRPNCSEPHTLESRERAALTEAERVVERVAYLQPPTGLRSLLTPRDRIAKLTAAGATADEIVEVVTALRDAIESGAKKPDEWSASKVFSGFYHSLRTELLSERHEGWT